METVYVTWQYCQDDNDITSHPFPMQDATEVHVWDQDSLVAAFERNAHTGRWELTGTDGVMFPGWYEMEFSTPEEGLLIIGEKWEMTFIGE